MSTLETSLVTADLFQALCDVWTAARSVAHEPTAAAMELLRHADEAATVAANAYNGQHRHVIGTVLKQFRDDHEAVASRTITKTVTHDAQGNIVSVTERPGA